MSNPTPNNPQSLRQTLGNALGGRTNRKAVQLSADPVTLNKKFTMEQRTYQDPQTGDIVTEELGSQYLLACGCLVSSPVGLKACPGCSTFNRKGAWKKPRLICGQLHTLCARCRKKRLLELNGGGFLRKAMCLLLTILLWPLFDVYEDRRT
jgi:hypothetical protein